MARENGIFGQVSAGDCREGAVFGEGLNVGGRRNMTGVHIMAFWGI